MAMRPKSRSGKLGVVCLAAVMLTVGYIMGQSEQSEEHKIGLVGEAEAAGGVVQSPTDAAPDRYVYYPGTEDLGSEEIRVIACGTGLPAARRSQAARAPGQAGKG